MEKQITGMMIYYYFVCKRKLWYFCHDINMENLNTDVQIGKFLDESSYGREDKHLNIDNVINIDYIKEMNILHEIKKSRAIEKAGIWQVKYYLFYLKQRGVILKGRIDYPTIKQSVDVVLTGEDEAELERIMQEIQSIYNMEKPFDFVKQPICNKCAYKDLCLI